MVTVVWFCPVCPRRHRLHRTAHDVRALGVLLATLAPLPVPARTETP